MIYSIIGSNYGDEGKGLATDYLASHPGKSLVVRHNGGAQSGHTVEIGEKRFVFHELGSGAFRGADTYWADSFHPDLYKLAEELRSFGELSERIPAIYTSADACITTIDDVLINMLLESSRGEGRHGSCGMGINEAELRGNAGFALPIGSLREMPSECLYAELKRIREQYSIRRLWEMGAGHSGEYFEMLQDDSVLRNYADSVMQNFRFVRIMPQSKAFFQEYDRVIFEGGQGLRLDGEYRENWPHVTASRTGLTNVLRILDEMSLKLDEAIYVTRSYVTKHGAGPLKNECRAAQISRELDDKTNVFNPWQQALRFAEWDDPADFLTAVHADRSQCEYPVRTSLMITHLNETDHKMLFRSGDMEIGAFAECGEIRKTFQQIYLSSSRFSDDIRTHRTSRN